MGKRLITRRGIRRGLSQTDIDQKIERREAMKLKIKSTALGGIIQPIAETALSIVPGAGVLAKGLSKLPVLSKVPVIKTVVEEGASQFDLKVETAGGPMAVVQDLIFPAQEAYANQEYGKLAFQLGILMVGVLLIVYL